MRLENFGEKSEAGKGREVLVNEDNVVADRLTHQPAHCHEYQLIQGPNKIVLISFLLIIEITIQSYDEQVNVNSERTVKE